MKPSNKTAMELWNECFIQVRAEGVRFNLSWLDQYISILHDRQIETILEIGCGSGNDTKFLVENGFTVTATDFSEEAISIVREAIPGTEVLLHDTRDKFPFEDQSFDLVLASLSLHYFDKSMMMQILNEIKRMLKDNGSLLIRLNSINDEDAQKVHPIERYFYSIQSCRELFLDWEEIVLRETTVDYYGKQKTLIEGLFGKKFINLD